MTTKTFSAFVLFRFDPDWKGEPNRSRVVGTMRGDERPVHPQPGSKLERDIVSWLFKFGNERRRQRISFWCELDATFPHYLVATTGICQRLWQFDHPAKHLLVIVDSQNAESFSEAFRMNKRFDALVETIAKELPSRKLVASAVFIPDNEYTKELGLTLAYTHVSVYMCRPRRVNLTHIGIEYHDHNVDPAMIATTGKLIRQYGADSVCIVSGDGDFIPLLEELQGQGIEVGVASTRSKLNGFFIPRAQFLVIMDDLMPVIDALPPLLRPKSAQQPTLTGHWKRRTSSVRYFRKPRKDGGNQ